MAESWARENDGLPRRVYSWVLHYVFKSVIARSCTLKTLVHASDSCFTCRCSVNVNLSVKVVATCCISFCYRKPPCSRNIISNVWECSMFVASAWIKLSTTVCRTCIISALFVSACVRCCQIPNEMLFNTFYLHGWLHRPCWQWLWAESNPRFLIVCGVGLILFT